MIVKNTRGHLLHELGEAPTAPAESVRFFPAVRFSPAQRDAFEDVAYGPLLPEVGSRLLQRVLGIEPLIDDWIEVQPDVYRYAVIDHGDAVTVRTLIRNCLASEVTWALE